MLNLLYYFLLLAEQTSIVALITLSIYVWLVCIGQLSVLARLRS